MADTYNENEILKLKHLNEFARQLNIKLDGTKQARTVSYRCRGDTDFIPDNQIETPINTLLGVFLSENSPAWVMVYRNILDFNDTSRVILQNITTTDTNFTSSQLVYVREVFQSNDIHATSRTDIFFYLNSVPQTLEFDMLIPENKTYAETRHHITINIMEA